LPKYTFFFRYFPLKGKMFFLNRLLKNPVKPYV